MKTANKNKKRAGFTLIEIMVVVLIIGLLVSVVGPNIWNALVKNQASIANTQIRGFHDAMDQFKLNNYKWPDSMEALTEPDPATGSPVLKRIPLDPWQNEYVMEIDSDGKPIIICYGADGVPGGEAENQDISSETIGL
ncbi:MAG: type II secretion system major pseudopilin GspG [Planctomycetota bacterium]|nr:type II secretion system major pseudopilin GspG [Planctomycetota bacterium]MDA1112887.1 type II secretion system major pseudopilin GspG [Planctomycetota bacterium]